MGAGRTTPARLSRAKSRRTFWLAAIVVLAAAVAHSGGGNTASGAGGRARVGRAAPDFTLRLLNGESITLSSLKGKPVLVNFWHSG